MKALLAIALLAVGVVQAAAQFVLAPTDASLPKNPFGGTVSTPYGAGSYTYSNGAYGGSAGGNPCSLGGEVTFRYKWQGSPGSAPPQAVAHVTASAAWNYAQSGSASDGISGSDYHAYPGGGGGSPHGSASGEKWEVEDVKPDGTFDVKLTPSASTSGSCSVSVSVEVYAASLSVSGTILKDGGLRALIGSQQTGSVSVSGLEPKNHTWSVSGGQPFLYLAETPGNNGQSSREYKSKGSLDQIDKHPVTKSFYASKEDDETVNCSVDLCRPGSTTVLTTVQLTRKVQIIAPDATFEIVNASTVPAGFDNSFSPPHVISGDPYAVEFQYKANVVSDFPQGKVALLQKIAENTTYSPSPPGGHFGYATPRLDGVFPYPSSEFGSGPAVQSDHDTPEESVISGATGVDLNCSFMTTSMFQPSDGVYVPLISKNWTWSVVGNANSNGNWGASSGSVGIITSGGSRYVLENAEYNNVARNQHRYDYGTGTEYP